MICTKEGCEGKLRVTNTYSQATSKFQRAVCVTCKRVHVVQCIVEPVVRKGDGAKARARKASRPF